MQANGFVGSGLPIWTESLGCFAENYLFDNGTPAARPVRKAWGLVEGDGLAAETDAAGAIVGMQRPTL